jgi:hypothetical protein
VTRKSFWRAAVIAVFCAFSPAPHPVLAAAVPGQDEVLPRIAKAAPHPRLFWTAGEEKAVREKVQQDPRLNHAWEAVRITADHMCGEPPVVYRKEGRRLLGRSREALSRIIHLGFAYRLTGEQRYLDRASAEMKAMAGMPDWNPSHFLDTAEMTLAMAIGYDWFYHQLSPEIRALVREAIEKKGLGPYLESRAKPGWERGGNNWNQVCHAGMVAGALALAEEGPERAAETVSRALGGLPNAMKVYDPDGTYPEGPGYWNYGTTFNVALISMLESALGTDFGLSQSRGFLKTGEFPLQMTGPTRNYFNFSDCGSGAGFSPAMTWFAARAHRPELLWFEWELLERQVARIRNSQGAEQADRFFPFILLWAEAGLVPKAPAALNWLGRGPNPLAVFRSSWTDPNALYLALKAGSPGASHAHMDIGSFVLDANGVRWALDLGSQDYHAMESRGLDIWNNRPGSDRWRIFRYHNRAHSTLLVDDQEQAVKSMAPITEFSGDPNHAFAVVDMTATYAGQLPRAVRHFTVPPDRRVVVEDDLKGGTKTADVRWGMVTRAVLKSAGAAAAWLEKDGKRLRIEVASPAGVSLHSWPADPPPHDFDEPNPGVSVVGFTVPVGAGQEVVLKVVLTPET